MAGWDELAATRLAALGQEVDQVRGFRLDAGQYVTRIGLLVRP